MVTRTALRRIGNGKPFREGLPPRVQRTKLNVGEVERLLPRSDQYQEWIRWIDPAVRVSQDMHYLPIRVDLEAGLVSGLPTRWRDMADVVLRLTADNAEEFDLGAEFEEIMLASARKNTHGATEPQATVDQYLTAQLTAADVAVSASEKHRQRADFASAATGSCFIIANGLTESSAAAVKALVVPLLKRGVNVDLMWSAAEGETKAISEAVKQARGGGGTGKLTLLDHACAVTDLVLGTTPSGPVALLGTSLFTQADRGRHHQTRRSPRPHLPGPPVRRLVGGRCRRRHRHCRLPLATHRRGVGQRGRP